MISGCVGLELILLGFRLCLGQPSTTPTVIDTYAQNCTIFRPSRKDTDESLRQMNTENTRCRAAREKK